MKVRPIIRPFVPLRDPNTKKPKITNLCREINKLGKAIINSARYLILESLSKSPKNVGQLSKIINMEQPAVSNHLKLLQGLGLVDGFKNGKMVIYKLEKGRLKLLLEKLSVLIK